MKDGCEWNPAEDRLTRSDEESHAPAEVILGTNGDYRLCVKCSLGPRFRHYRVSRPIVRTLPDSRRKEG